MSRTQSYDANTSDRSAGTRRGAVWTRRLSRGIGSLAAGFWILIGLLLSILGSEPWTGESAALAMLIVAAALSVLVAWRREGLGGILVLISGMAHRAFAFLAAGHSRSIAIAVSGGPFVIAGGLFLCSWRLSQPAAPQRAGAAQ